jgi:hypothetical protein
MAEKLATADLLGVDVDRLDDVAQYAQGSRVIDSGGNTREYVKAGAALAIGDALTMGTYTASNRVWIQTSAVNQPVFGVSHAVVAINQFSWVYTAPSEFVIVKAATVVAGQPLVSTATSGTLDDTAAAAANALAAAGGIGVTAVGADATLGAGAGFAPVRLS